MKRNVGCPTTMDWPNDPVKVTNSFKINRLSCVQNVLFTYSYHVFINKLNFVDVKFFEVKRVLSNILTTISAFGFSSFSGWRLDTSRFRYRLLATSFRWALSVKVLIYYLVSICSDFDRVKVTKNRTIIHIHKQTTFLKWQ